jgi:hypothetical protein
MFRYITFLIICGHNFQTTKSLTCCTPTRSQFEVNVIIQGALSYTVTFTFTFKYFINDYNCSFHGMLYWELPHQHIFFVMKWINKQKNNNNKNNSMWLDCMGYTTITIISLLNLLAPVWLTVVFYTLCLIVGDFKPNGRNVRMSLWKVFNSANVSLYTGMQTEQATLVKTG